MAHIGTFTKTDKGYTGTIRTLAINAKVTIVTETERASDKSPDYRIFSGSVELGAAWNKIAKNGEAKSGEERRYLTVKLDDPSFPASIFANLVEMDGKYQLIWSR